MLKDIYDAVHCKARMTCLDWINTRLRDLIKTILKRVVQNVVVVVVVFFQRYFFQFLQEILLETPAI